MRKLAASWHGMLLNAHPPTQTPFFLLVREGVLGVGDYSYPFRLGCVRLVVIAGLVLNGTFVVMYKTGLWFFII